MPTDEKPLGQPQSNFIPDAIRAGHAGPAAQEDAAAQDARKNTAMLEVLKHFNQAGFRDIPVFEAVDGGKARDQEGNIIDADAALERDIQRTCLPFLDKTTNVPIDKESEVIVDDMSRFLRSLPPDIRKQAIDTLIKERDASPAAYRNLLAKGSELGNIMHEENLSPEQIQAGLQRAAEKINDIGKGKDDLTAEEFLKELEEMAYEEEKPPHSLATIVDEPEESPADKIPYMMAGLNTLSILETCTNLVEDTIITAMKNIQNAHGAGNAWKLFGHIVSKLAGIPEKAVGGLEMMLIGKFREHISTLEKSGEISTDYFNILDRNAHDRLGQLHQDITNQNLPAWEGRITQPSGRSDEVSADLAASVNDTAGDVGNDIGR